MYKKTKLFKSVAAAKLSAGLLSDFPLTFSMHNN
jgi:hypothetical protein